MRELHDGGATIFLLAVVVHARPRIPIRLARQLDRGLHQARDLRSCRVGDGGVGNRLSSRLGARVRRRADPRCTRSRHALQLLLPAGRSTNSIVALDDSRDSCRDPRLCLCHRPARCAGPPAATHCRQPMPDRGAGPWDGGTKASPVAVHFGGRARTVNAFLEFLPTVGLAMVVNLGRGYPDTVLAEKFLMHCWKPFSLHHLVVQLWYHQVIQERGLSALTNKYKQQIE